MPSRGNAISAYIPAFAKGAQVYGANIASGVITSAHIADGTVIAADVAAGSITSAKIGTGAVVEAKIGAAAVTSAKIGTGAVVAAKIGAAAVTSAKLGSQAVTSAKIRAAFLSGSIVSGKMTRAIAHGLGVKPKSIVVCAIGTLAQISGANPPTIALAAASAATSANFYVIGSQTQNTALKYSAYLQL